jgi:hypothetical protein
MSERLSRDLAAVGELLAGIEDRVVEASRRVGEADGRLERELDRVHSDVDIAIQSLRDDVAAAIADIRATVHRELMMVPLISELRDELLGRIEALEAEVRATRDAG